MLPEIRTTVPGPSSRSILESLRRHECRNTTTVGERFPVVWERAEGANVWDADGNRYLDLTSAFGVATLGHRPAEVVAALRGQAEELLHAMGDVHPPSGKARLCEALSGATFARWGMGRGRVLLGNSGFEAVEAAMKTAVLATGKPGVIAFEGGYHGLGYGTLDPVGIERFRTPFREQLKGFAERVPFPSCASCPYGETGGFRLEGAGFPNCSSVCLERIVGEVERIARRGVAGCVLVEPVQGRGGILVPPRDFLPMLRTLCDDHGMLLVVDEIYTGFNRTGRLFGIDHFGVVPDLVCLGKALTGGFPLSACVGRADLMDCWPEPRGEALHTSTFLGHPVGCAMALASMESHCSPAIARKIREVSGHLERALASLEHPLVADRRGLGLMRGVELRHPDGTPAGDAAMRVVELALSQGVIILTDGPQGNVLAFTPPMVMDSEEIDYAADVVANALDAC